VRRFRDYAELDLARSRHDGSDPVIWLDGLDVPIVNLFKASFSEDNATKQTPAGSPPGDCEARYAGAMLPASPTGGPEGCKVDSFSSPLLNYRYARARESLATMLRNGPVDACQGVKLRYANPLTGGSPMPTISAAIQLLPTGFRTEPYRSTDGTVFVVIEGGGRSEMGDASFDWARTMCSSRRVGRCSDITRRAMRCSSVSLIARRRKNSACGARSTMSPAANRLVLRTARSGFLGQTSSE
jgi:hypothetical protein